MHIALFSPGWPLAQFHNGIVSYVHAVRPELEALGHRVSVFAGAVVGVQDERVHLVRHRRLAAAMRRGARRFFTAEREIYGYGRLVADTMLAVHRDEPIDVIEMEESFGWFADVGRTTSIPVLVKLHGPAFLSLVEDELATPLGKLRIEREGQALANASAIASPSMRTLEQTLDRYRLSPPIGEHVVNPILLRDNTPRWTLADCDPNTILFVGRFDLRKGADVLMQAFCLLLQQRPNLKLVMVGPDIGLSQSDGSRIGFEAYRTSLLPPAMRERVEFRGKMPNAEIAALRVRAMATVVASRWENQGYTLLEAMAQGCPVVCSDAGGSPESVIHGRTGLLARSEQPADFALQLATLLDDRQCAETLGASARQYVLDNHSVRKVATDSVALYERVIASGNPIGNSR